MLRVVTIVGLLIAPVVALTADARADNRGFVGSAALSYGRYYYRYADVTDGEVTIGAETGLGWGVTPWLAVLGRGALVNDDKDWLAELQVAARVWPWLDDVPWLSFQLHTGLGGYLQHFDCGGPTDPCSGGNHPGFAIGVSARAAMLRGRHGSLDVVLTRDEARFGDRHFAATMLSLGFSVF